MHPNDTISETWRPIVGYEGIYSVSDRGRVRRDRRGHHTHVGLILQGSLDRYGYRFVLLYRDGRRHKWLIHQLVAAAFLGTRPTNYQTNHKDGCKTHNTPDNLEYLTPAAHGRHSTMMGLRASGARHAFVQNPQLASHGIKCWRAQLTDDKVRAIRQLGADGWSTKQIADQFGVSVQIIQRVLRRASWKHVE